MKHLNCKGVAVGVGKTVGYKEIEDALSNWIYQNLTVSNPDLLKLFSWDIFDFIEMAYKEMGSTVNPISDGQAILFTAHSEFHGDYVYLVIPVGLHLIVIGLARRA